MNDFQSLNSGAGMLKSDYGTASGQDSPVLAALKRKRKNLSDKVVVPTKEKIEGTPNGDDADDS
jgi:hypothetical protein